MAKWKEVKISDLGEVVGGATPPTSRQDYYDGDIAWITPKDLADHKSRFISRGERSITPAGLASCSARIMPKNTVLFTSRAPIGYVAIANNSLCTNQGFKSVIPNADTDYSFLYYLLIYNRGKIESFASGTTFKEVSGAVMRNISVIVPALDVQKKIASILSALDDKIECNNRINKNLEEQIKLLYQSYFIDNRQSEWEKVPLSDLIMFQEGPGIRNWQYVADGVNFINIRCINNGEINLTTANKISEEEAFGKYRHFLLKPYDIVMSCSGTLGRYAIVQKKDLPLCLNTSVIRFYPKNSQDDYGYVYGYITSDEFLNHQLMMANGSAQVNFGPTHLKRIEILKPPVDVRKEFNNIVMPLIETLITNREQNKKLTNIRDSLLPKLMSGELDADNLELYYKH